MKPRLVFIVGPTASGKSDLAVEAALEFQRSSRSEPVEIINCDSVQFFSAVEIGAAKPTRDQLEKVPHHLIGTVPKTAEYAAGHFRNEALKIIEEGVSRGVTRFLAVGGSGFYIQALEKGMYDVPDVAPAIRAQVEEDLKENGSQSLHGELAARDPEAAGRIHPNDPYRIARALEILRADTSGKTLSQMRAEFEAKRPSPPFDVHKIGLRLSRDRLRLRIEARTRRMLAEGLIEETRALREEGLAEWAPLSSVGYKETQLFLDGAMTREDLEPAIITATFQLAKRQMTWFKRDDAITWFDPETQWDLAKSALLARLK